MPPMILDPIAPLSRRAEGGIILELKLEEVRRNIFGLSVWRRIHEPPPRQYCYEPRWVERLLCRTEPFCASDEKPEPDSLGVHSGVHDLYRIRGHPV